MTKPIVAVLSCGSVSTNCGGEIVTSGDLDNAVLDNPALDNPVWAALHGAHAHLAETKGNAARYPKDISPFAALPDSPDDQAWADLAALVGPGGRVTGMALQPPAGWEVVANLIGVQMIGTEVDGAIDQDAIVLGTDDVPEMLDLVARTEPGPFRPRTIELGIYVGIRDNGNSQPWRVNAFDPPAGPKSAPFVLMMPTADADSRRD